MAVAESVAETDCTDKQVRCEVERSVLITINENVMLCYVFMFLRLVDNGSPLTRLCVRVCVKMITSATSHRAVYVERVSTRMVATTVSTTP